MRRLGVSVVVSLVVLSLFAVPGSASAAAAHTPVLGQKHLFAPGGKGWGHAHPAEIFNGGDPSGRVWSIAWKHWGSDKSIGRGLGNQFKPSGGYYRHPVHAQLRATGLGHCTKSGPRAYVHLHVRLQKKPGSSHWTKWFRWAGMKRICK